MNENCIYVAFCLLWLYQNSLSLNSLERNDNANNNDVNTIIQGIKHLRQKYVIKALAPVIFATLYIIALECDWKTSYLDLQGNAIASYPNDLWQDVR